MVNNTLVENGRTVRVWEESRGNKTLVRKFYIAYEVNARLNGKYGRKVLNTFDEAVECAKAWQKAVAEKYGFEGWSLNDRQIFTHIDGTAFFATGGGKNSAYCYITEVNPGEPVISEELVA